MANPIDLITKLLAKAESTTPEEAEVLIGKAQELATKYAIEQGIIDQARAARGEAVREGFKRIRLCTERNTPLIKAKRQLVNWLANVNNCFVVMGHRRAYLEVTGFESDIIMLEHLFASLLLQMQRSMGQAEARGEVYGTVASWRVSFAYGFVDRVGVRLLDAKKAQTREADAGTPGTALVLRNRAQLAKEFAEGYYEGGLTKGRRIPRSDNNVYGSISGDRAGRNADLGGDRLGSTSRKEIGA
jgi:hypothetical protein